MFDTCDTFFFVQNHQGPVFNQINQWLARSHFRCFGFSSAEQLIDRIDQLGPVACVAIFGPVLQDMSGLQLASRLHSETPSVATMMVLRSSDIRTATQAILSGNPLLLFDDCDPAETLTQLGAATQLAQENHLRSRGHQAIVSRLQRLTAEQLELLRHWCQGIGNSRLLARLGIDAATLVEHKKAIRAKLEINRVVQLLWEVNRLELDIDALLASVQPLDDQAVESLRKAGCVKLSEEVGPVAAGIAGVGPTGSGRNRLRTAI
jgi:FixJ family two-component response regulator